MCIIHKYKLLETYKFEDELKNYYGTRMDGFLARDLAKRGIISVVQCEKCGRIKHTRTIL